MNWMQRSVMLFALCLSVAAGAQNRAPEIRNLSAAIDTAGGTVHVQYDLIDPDSYTVEIILRASNDHGHNWLIYTDDAAGDIGPAVRPGKNKRIVWRYNKQLANPMGFKVKLVADDGGATAYHGLVQQVDSNRIALDISTLQGVRHYLKGAPGLEIAKRLIDNRCYELNLETRKQRFMLGGYEGHNYAGLSRGQVQEDEKVLVVAHYDTHADSPGANDNASGLAVMLETARILSQQLFRRSIEFVAIDLQKQGGIGVRRFVQKISDHEADHIKAVYNLDNVGIFSAQTGTQALSERQQKMFPQLTQDLDHRDWKGDFLFAISNTKSVPARNNFVEMADAYAPRLFVEGLKTAGKGTEEHLFGSGAYKPFWDRGIPAVLITDGAESRNPNYDSAGDLAKAIDVSGSGDVARALLATLAEDAGWIHGDVKTTSVTLKKVERKIEPIATDLVDYHLYLTDQNGKLKVRINHPAQGKLQLKLMDLKGEVFYHSRIDLYYKSVISIDVSYLEAGVYLVNLSSSHFDELKEFIMP